MSKRQTFYFAALALILLEISGCSTENQNTSEGQVLAPGINYAAVIFHRNADKLRTETENISIVREGEPILNDIGNIYSASREDSSSPQKLWINWRSPNTLQIFRNPSTHSYKEEKHFECMTGIFLQTTPFTIEYGDIKDIHPPDKAEAKVAKVSKSPKTSKKKGHR